MSKAPDRENALLAQLELEKICRAAGLPFVCLIAIPDENGISRASLSMLDPMNRVMMLVNFADYMHDLARIQAEHDEQIARGENPQGDWDRL